MARRKNSAELFELLNRLASEEAQKQDRSESDRTERRRTDERRSHQRRSQAARSPEVDVDGQASSVPVEPASEGQPQKVLVGDSGDGNSKDGNSKDGGAGRARGFLSILSPGRQPVRSKGAELRPSRRRGVDDRDAGGGDGLRSVASPTPIDSIFESLDKSSIGGGPFDPQTAAGPDDQGPRRDHASDEEFQEGSSDAPRDLASRARAGRRKSQTVAPGQAPSKRKTVRIRRDDSLTPEVVSREGDAPARALLRQEDPPRSRRAVTGRASESDVGLPRQAGRRDAAFEDLHGDDIPGDDIPGDDLQREVSHGEELHDQTRVPAGLARPGHPTVGTRDVASLPFPYNRILAAVQRRAAEDARRAAARMSGVENVDSILPTAEFVATAETPASSQTLADTPAESVSTHAPVAVAAPTMLAAAAVSELEARSTLEEDETDDVAAESAEAGSGGDSGENATSSGPAPQRVRRVIAKKRRGKSSGSGGGKSPATGSRATDEGTSGAVPSASSAEPASTASTTQKESKGESPADVTPDPTAMPSGDCPGGNPGQPAQPAPSANKAGVVPERNDPKSSDTAPGDGEPERAVVVAASESTGEAHAAQTTEAQASSSGQADPAAQGKLRRAVELVVGDEIAKVFRKPLEVRVSTLLVSAAVLVVVVALGVRYKQSLTSESNRPEPSGPSASGALDPGSQLLPTAADFAADFADDDLAADDRAKGVGTADVSADETAMSAQNALAELEFVSPKPGLLAEVRNVQSRGDGADEVDSTQVAEVAHRGEPPPAGGGNYFVQVRAFIGDDEFRSMADYMHSLGFDGVYRGPMDGRPGRYYLFLGPYRDSAEAVLAQQQFETRNQQDPYKKSPRIFQDSFVQQPLSDESLALLSRG